jgi:hypothetical protein
LREIKQVELYTKWRKFVPSQYRDIVYPKPSDDVLGRVKTDLAVKAKQSKAKQIKAKKIKAKQIKGQGQRVRRSRKALKKYRTP